MHVSRLFKRVRSILRVFQGKYSNFFNQQTHNVKNFVGQINEMTNLKANF